VCEVVRVLQIVPTGGICDTPHSKVAAQNKMRPSAVMTKVIAKNKTGSDAGHKKETEVVLNLTSHRGACYTKGYIPRIEETEFFFELLENYVVGDYQESHNLGGHDLEYLGDDASYYCMRTFINCCMAFMDPKGAQEYLEKTLGVKVSEATAYDDERPPSPVSFGDHPYEAYCYLDPWWQDGSLDALEKKIKKLFTEEAGSLLLEWSDPHKLQCMGYPISVQAVVDCLDPARPGSPGNMPPAW